MERVSMNDGLDGRETVAFGLAAGEVAVLVVAFLTADALVHSGLPGALRWALGVVVAAGGAVLAWGRLEGRPLAEWAVLAARFAVRTRGPRVRAAALTAPHSAAGTVARAWHAAQNRATPPFARHRSGSPLALGDRARAAVLDRRMATPVADRPAIVVDLRLRGPGDEAGEAVENRAPAGRPPRDAWVVAFFSLAGGSGRTTLALEVASWLASRRRVDVAAGRRTGGVALVDLCQRNPSASLRLGVTPPRTASSSNVVTRVGHGLLVLASAAACGDPASDVADAIAAVEREGAGVVVADVDSDLGERCRAVLARCDRVVVTVTPTVAGVLDAYRSTAALRRLGLRDRITYCGNRWRPGADLSEAMADLGGELVATVPEHAAFVEAEARHGAAGLGGTPDVAGAVARLALAVGARPDGAAALQRAHAG